MQVTMTVNGEEVSADVEPRLLLVHFVRDHLGLTGTHWGCDTSNCGTCVLWMDGEPVKSCTVLTAMASGHAIRTVEDLEQDGELDPVQSAFMNEHGLQCGFCTPGMMMTARWLLDHNPDPSRSRDPRGHLRPDLPLHRLREHRPRGARRRRPSVRPEHGGGARMTTTENPATTEDTGSPAPAGPPPEPIGFGRMLRKEDARFIRGKGNYVDDINLPGMLHGAVLRSPLAHARIKSIDTSAAEAHPKVKAVITGAVLETLGLAWIPALSNDTLAVLATDKVRFQGQEVAFVVAEDRYSARDALELIDVDYEPLPAVIDARHAMDADAPVIRDDKEGKTDNHIFDWESGNKDETDAVFAKADVVVTEDMLYPRVHPAPMETCGQIADMNKVTGKLTIYCTTQAPHAHRTLYALVAGLPEHKIQVISPDIGGGFGNKVGIYPGYVLTVVGSIVTGKPVKWVEDRSENLMSTSFARDYHMHGEIAATRDGKITGLRVKVLADHGAFNNTAQPTKFPAGFFHIFTGSYDLDAAHCEVTGVYSNKAPGGVAYACSFRVTEAVYLVERMVDCLADELGVDPAELRMKNLLRPEQFPYTCKTGWVYDSGDYPRAMRLAMDMAGYDDLRKEQAEKRARGELMGIGCSFFTETVGAGPAQVHGHPRARHGRRRRGARAPDRQGRRPPLGADPGPGPRDDVRPDRGRGARHPAERHRGRPRRHRPDAVRPRHLRLALDAGVGRGGRGRVAARARQGAHRRLGDDGGVARRPRVGEGPLLREGRPVAGPHHPGDRARRARHGLAARGGGGPPRRRLRLRPAQPHLPVRRVHLRGRRRRRHRPGEGAALHRGRRLRAAHQPDDRRGAGARRPRRRRRHGADGGHRVRRGRQLPRRLVHGLPAADVDGVPELGARRDGHAVAAPPAGREGRGGVGDGRLARRGGQRGARRHPGAARGHAADVRAGVAGHAGRRRSGPTWPSSELARRDWCD